MPGVMERAVLRSEGELAHRSRSFALFSGEFTLMSLVGSLTHLSSVLADITA